MITITYWKPSLGKVYERKVRNTREQSLSPMTGLIEALVQNLLTIINKCYTTHFKAIPRSSTVVQCYCKSDDKLLTVRSDQQCKMLQLEHHQSHNWVQQSSYKNVALPMVSYPYNCHWLKDLYKISWLQVLNHYYTLQNSTRSKYHGVSVILIWSPSKKCRKEKIFIEIFIIVWKLKQMAKYVFSWPAHFKNGQSGSPVNTV